MARQPEIKLNIYHKKTRYQVLAALKYFESHPNEKYKLVGKKINFPTLKDILNKQFKMSFKFPGEFINYFEITFSSEKKGSKTDSPPKPKTETIKPEELTTNLSDKRSLQAIIHTQEQASKAAQIAFGRFVQKNLLSPTVMAHINGAAFNIFLANPGADPQTIANTLLVRIYETTTLKKTPSHKTTQKEIAKNIAAIRKQAKESVGRFETTDNKTIKTWTKIIQENSKLSQEKATQKAIDIMETIEISALAINANQSPEDYVNTITRELDSITPQAPNQKGSVEVSQKDPKITSFIRIIASQEGGTASLSLAHQRAAYSVSQNLHSSLQPTSTSGGYFRQVFIQFNNNPSLRNTSLSRKISWINQSYDRRSSSRPPIKSSSSFLRNILGRVSGGVKRKAIQKIIPNDKLLNVVKQVSGGKGKLFDLASNALGGGSKLLSGAEAGGLAAEAGTAAKLGASGLRGLLGTGAKAAGQGLVTAGTAAVEGIAALTAGTGGTIWIVVGIIAILIIVIALVQGAPFGTERRAQIIATGDEGGTSGGESNPFIRVEKTASPSKMDTPSEVITYSYTITALAETITINGFTDETKAFTQDGEVSVSVDAPPPPDGLVVDFGTPWSSPEFTLDPTSNLQDSIITNTITISATTESGEATEFIASASVIIGDPPTDCMILSDESATSPNGLPSSPWDTDATAKQFIITAVLKILESPTYSSYVCADGEVKIYYVRDNNSGGGWVSGRDIFIFGTGGSRGGVFSQGSAIYTLAHETGHVINNSSQAGLYTQFESQGISVREGFIHTYPNAKTTREDFAETIGLYVGKKYYQGSSWGSFSYQDRYPLHHDFAKQTLFGGYEY